jgi:hypothetical protein
MARIFDSLLDTLISRGHTPDYIGIERYAIDPDMPAAVPYKYVKTTLGTKLFKGATISTGIPSEMTQGEKDAVDAAELAAVKVTRKLALQHDGDNYLLDRYNGVVDELDALYADAVRSKPNRAAYIRPWVEWKGTITSEVLAKQTAVDAATTVEAVNAIVIDTATLDASDPDITPAGALAISDATDLDAFLDANAVVNDTPSGISGPFYLMQQLVNRREIFNDSENPLYVADHIPLIGATGSVTNLNNIHGKAGWHHQEEIKQGWRRPTDVLFYYGYPNAFNSAINGWVNEKVAQDMAKYGVVVLGNGVQDPGHADYGNTTVIIPRVKALNPECKIFGYVSLNQTQGNFETKVGQWETLQVHGIFIDEAGYDYGKTRAEFNTAVAYVHARTYAKIAFANAWNTDHVLGTANDVSFPNSTFNPTPVESNLTADDWILLESLAVNTTAYAGNAGYASKDDWIARIDKAAYLRYTYSVNFAGIGMINDDNSNGQALFNFSFTSALMGCLEAHGTSSTNYGASTAQVKLWTRPDTSKIGYVWNLSPAIVVDAGDADVYHRYAEFAKMSLDFSTGAQASRIVRDSNGWKQLLANVVISNSVAATNVINVTVPGGTVLDDGDALRLVALGRFFNNSGSNRSFILRIKVGGVTVYEDSTGTIATNTGNRGVRFILDIIRTSPTTAEIVGELLIASSSAATTGRADIGATAIRSAPIIATSALAWTFEQNTALVVSVQLSNAEAVSEFELYRGTIK